MEKVNQFQLDVDMVDADGETSRRIRSLPNRRRRSRHSITGRRSMGKKASLEVQMVAREKESEEKTREITKFTCALRTTEQEIEKLKGAAAVLCTDLGDKGAGLAALRDPDGQVQDVKHKGAGELQIEIC